MYIYIYINIHTHIHIYIYIYIYTHTYTHTHIYTHTYQGRGSRIFVRRGGAIIYCKGREPKKKKKDHSYLTPYICLL